MLLINNKLIIKYDLCCYIFKKEYKTTLKEFDVRTKACGRASPWFSEKEVLNA